MKTHVGMFVVGMITVSACAARAQESPVLPSPAPVPAVQAATPPPQSSTVQTPPAQTPPAQTPPVQPPQAQTPPSQTPPVQTPPAQGQTPPPSTQDAASAPAAPPAPRTLASAPLGPEEVRDRRSAIFLMEGVFANAVRLAAARTADQIQAIEQTPIIFTSAPARAHGSYLDGYGVFFHVEIPSVVPSVSSLVETIQRERLRQSNPAQPANIAGGVTPSGTIINPDATYVESVKRQLVGAMLDHSKALDLRADEWLTVEAREAQETPGQISQPSTLVLRVRGSDLAEFQALRLSREEVLKRVQIRGF